MGHCVMKNPAAGGGRWVEVPPERLVTWVVTFAQRHGGATLGGPATPDETGAAVTFTAADGATAECHPPFPPVPSGVPAGDVRAAAEALAAHAAADAAAEVFGRYGPDRLDAVVLGGDKRSAAGLRELRGDTRLEKYLAKGTGRFLTVPDPRPAVLRDIPRAFLATRIRLTEPESIG